MNRKTSRKNSDMIINKYVVYGRYKTRWRTGDVVVSKWKWIKKEGTSKCVTVTIFRSIGFYVAPCNDMGCDVYIYCVSCIFSKERSAQAWNRSFSPCEMWEMNWFIKNLWVNAVNFTASTLFLSLLKQMTSICPLCTWRFYHLA